jgi:signal transduction histidine kinase
MLQDRQYPLAAMKGQSEGATIPLTFEDTDLGDLIQGSLKPLIEQAARSRIDLRFATLGEVPRMRVDREKLAWTVASLVGNALRYVSHGQIGGDAGGSIVVHLTPTEVPGEVAISVQDDGPGIPDDKLPFLFERRRGAVHAEGLALSLVRQIVAAHGGRIVVESRRDPGDHGTSVTIVLSPDLRSLTSS